MTTQDFVAVTIEMFSPSAWTAVGGLDERYLYGPEDIDFCDRLRRSGRTVLPTSAARCVHPPRRRHRRMLSRSGLRHGGAVVRYLWRRRWAARLSS